MSPTWHPPQAVLRDYVSAALPEGGSLFVACHLSFCEDCRRWVAALEAKAGEAFEALAAVPGPSSVPATLWSRLDEVQAAPPAPPKRGVFPEPLRALVGEPGDLSFRPLMRGVSRADLPVKTPGLPLRIHAISPGAVLPLHDHGGLERTLVLTGAFVDDRGRFGVGDVSWRGERAPHQPRIDSDEVCYALVWADRPLKPEAWWMRPVAWWFEV